MTTTSKSPASSLAIVEESDPAELETFQGRPIWHGGESRRHFLTRLAEWETAQDITET